MPLQIVFEAEGADRGTLRVRGLPDVGSEVLVAVQRLEDARYLTLHGLWDEGASWYPCPRLNADGGEEARFQASAALTAGLCGAAGARLRMFLRRRDFLDTGPLVIRASGPASAMEGPAAGTGPAVPPTAPSTTRDSPPAGRPERDEPAQGLQRPDDRVPPPSAVAADRRLDATGTRPAASTKPGPKRDRGTRLPALAGLAALGMACAGALLWWFATAEREAPIPSSAHPEPTQTMAAPTPAGLTGKARYLALKDAQLPPGERFAQAEGIAQEGDCEAAIRLLIDAAKREGSLAARLARRFDPEGFEPAPCFAAPQPDSALVWYQRAAEADIPQAQRRYGELLLAETSGGPVYRDAVAWLRKAAAAGDAAAADRLAALGER